ncbi:hypothetical protein [Sediminitomix flava]|uniref:Uncharacterized protein n=1 Tax=Sediminitomix flava TaxID=379075 RepID=A0A315ZBY5_SEDFL|nr:hypothetical protein [Sediminitomix flava]PWJ43086.1 hypothetical protein BC781_102634 [Sediminitomix flava]
MDKERKDKIQNLIEELIGEAMDGFKEQGRNKGGGFARDMADFAYEMEKEFGKRGRRRGRRNCADEETIVIEDEKNDAKSSNVDVEVNVKKDDSEISLLKAKIEALEVQLAEKDEVISLLKEQMATLKGIIDSKL